MSVFPRYIGIDYSGAETPTASLKGLRFNAADRASPPVEVIPPPSARKYWTRRGIAEWLVERLAEDAPTLVGIDHAFSFPIRYFETHGLKPDWPNFLDDFQRHWPTDRDIYVDFVRDGLVGNGTERMGNARWRRLIEERTRGAKSVFHFDVQGSVAKSTHAGIPWLRFLRQRLGERAHFWPFDGWDIPAGRSALAEVYPALWSRGFAREGRSGDQHDAYSIAHWLYRADRDGSLAAFLKPDLPPPERAVAQVEGWILGGRVELPPEMIPGARHEFLQPDGRIMSLIPGFPPAVLRDGDQGRRLKPHRGLWLLAPRRRSEICPQRIDAKRSPFSVVGRNM